MRLQPGLRVKLLDHAQEAAPIEACGLLGGDAMGLRCYVPCRNVQDSPVRYAVAPEEILRTLRWFTVKGLDLMGIFHAHPMGEAYPSATDVAEAAYPGVLHLIAAPTRAASLRGFWIVDGKVMEEPLSEV